MSEKVRKEPYTTSATCLSDGSTIPSGISLHLTNGGIEDYLQGKILRGVSPSAVAKYKAPLLYLCQWLHGEAATVEKLRDYRRELESAYSKNTVQTYVKVANNYFRALGRNDLCIPKPLRHDLRGMTFGYLTAIEPTEHRYRKDILWRCQCRCGTECLISTNQLTSGHKTSCGCLNMEILKHANRYVEGTSLRQSLDDTPRSTIAASGYTGVVAKRDKWQAFITYKKKRYSLGVYSNIDDAIKARARAKQLVMEDAARLEKVYASFFVEKPTRAAPPLLPEAPTEKPPLLPACRSDNTSGCPGVSRKGDKWLAYINYRGRRYRLGVYANKDEAIAARRRAESDIRAGRKPLLFQINNEKDVSLQSNGTEN